MDLPDGRAEADENAGILVLESSSDIVRPIELLKFCVSNPLGSFVESCSLSLLERPAKLSEA